MIFFNTIKFPELYSFSWFFLWGIGTYAGYKVLKGFLKDPSLPPLWKFQVSFIHFFKFLVLESPPMAREIQIPSVGAVWVIFSGIVHHMKLTKSGIFNNAFPWAVIYTLYKLIISPGFHCSLPYHSYSIYTLLLSRLLPHRSHVQFMQMCLSVQHQMAVQQLF